MSKILKKFSRLEEVMGKTVCDEFVRKCEDSDHSYYLVHSKQQLKRIAEYFHKLGDFSKEDLEMMLEDLEADEE